MFAITADSDFKIDYYAYSAIGVSSAACGLGIACDVWFVLRYIWVDLETFTVCTLPTPASSLTNLVIDSIVPVMFIIPTFSFPCRHVYPLCA